MMTFKKTFQIILPLLLLLVSPAVFAHAENPPEREPIILRAWGVPPTVEASVSGLVVLKILQEFTNQNPDIIPVSSAGLNLGTAGQTQDIVPLMQIAGDIPPHVMFVNFKYSPLT